MDLPAERFSNAAAKAPSNEPILITSTELAHMMSISLRSLWRLRSAGKLPEPVRLGGSVRWRREQLLDWIDSGCPDQDE